ncbi:protein-lysine N-methyltransferase [Sporobolomyces koalae]|uniref:protein-lysine N-methyltransferase n=1 Tax=Sporobolomyces koalae TaxID=500713 RepID=UPI0031759243
MSDPVAMSTQGNRSDSESLSGSPPPALDPSTLALLNSFYQEREQTEQQFRDLEEKAHKRMLKAQRINAGESKQDQDDLESREPDEVDPEDDKMMSVDEFRKLFQEDWQLSQFWYSAAFASQLCKFIYSFATPSTRIAFLCCPTSYVAFQNQNPLPDVWLLEYDGRFGLLGSKFVHYDLEEPDKIPATLFNSVDIAIADPPFLNEITNQHLSKGLQNILKPDGKLILLTSTSVTSLPKIYSQAPIGPLNETSLRVEHAGGIQNEFRVWTSWKFEGEREGVTLVDDPVF